MFRLKNQNQIDCSNVMNNVTAALQMNESIKNTKIITYTYSTVEQL